MEEAEDVFDGEEVQEEKEQHFTKAEWYVGLGNNSCNKHR